MYVIQAVIPEKKPKTSLLSERWEKKSEFVKKLVMTVKRFHSTFTAGLAYFFGGKKKIAIYLE